MLSSDIKSPAMAMTGMIDSLNRMAICDVWFKCVYMSLNYTADITNYRYFPSHLLAIYSIRSYFRVISYGTVSLEVVIRFPSWRDALLLNTTLHLHTKEQKHNVENVANTSIPREMLWDFFVLLNFWKCSRHHRFINMYTSCQTRGSKTHIPASCM